MKLSISEHKNIRKIENKIVKIWPKLKSWNLPNFKSENLFRFRKISSTSAIKKLNYITHNTSLAFSKWRWVFIYTIKDILS